MRALLLLLLLCGVAHAGAAPDRLQGGLYGGLGPSEPLYLQGLVGGWVGVGLGEALRLELSTSYQDGLESETDLARFLRDEALLDPEDPIADRTIWTAELLLRVEPWRGRVAALQSTVGELALHFAGGGGVRALKGASREDLAPALIGALGLDLRLATHLLLRADARGYGILRRDDSVGLGAELLLGIGIRL